jgi:hypothetical protein
MTTAFDFNAYHKAHWPDDGRSQAPAHVRALRDEHWSVPRIECADGLTLSVQASAFHYCTPRETGAHPYQSVEVGFPSERIEALMPYAEDAEAPTETVYGYVPVEVVNQIVTEHGGARAALAKVNE